MSKFKKPKLILGLMAILGTLVAWSIISLVIIDINLLQFLVIELVITIMHLVYNKAKKDFFILS